MLSMLIVRTTTFYVSNCCCPIDALTGWSSFLHCPGPHVQVPCVITAVTRSDSAHGEVWACACQGLYEAFRWPWTGSCPGRLQSPTRSGEFGFDDNYHNLAAHEHITSCWSRLITCSLRSSRMSGMHMMLTRACTLSPQCHDVNR